MSSLSKDGLNCSTAAGSLTSSCEYCRPSRCEPSSARIIRRPRAGAADMDARAAVAKRLRDAVADAAGAADHQDLLAAEIELVHRCPPVILFSCACSYRKTCFGSAGLTCLRIGASLVNLHPPPFPYSEYSMADFKKLSRSVKGLTVLVTGAACGMGRATAHVFADEGANVAVTDLTAEGTRRGCRRHRAPPAARPRPGRSTSAIPTAIVAVVDDVAAHFGALDIIINNAGMSRARRDRRRRLRRRLGQGARRSC